MMVSCDDTKKLLKFVSAKDLEETDHFKILKAQIHYEAFIEDGRIWTPEEKADFLSRVETGCREACEWFERNIKTQE